MVGVADNDTVFFFASFRFSPSSSSSSFAVAAAVFLAGEAFFVFFWEEERCVGDGRFLELESEGLCCFSGVVFMESKARDGDVGAVIRFGEISNAFSFSSFAAAVFSADFSSSPSASAVAVASAAMALASFSFSCLATASFNVFSKVTYSSHFSAFGNCSIINRTECNEYPKNSGPEMAVFFATSPFCSRMAFARCKTSPQHAVADFFSMTMEPSSVVKEKSGVFSVSSILISCVHVHFSSKFSGSNFEYNFLVLKPSGKM